MKTETRYKTYSLPVLLYHRIVNKNSLIGRHKIYVRQKNFEKQLMYLKENGYQTITFYDLLQNPSIDLHKKIVLTFDDGYEDNYTILFPLLKKYGFKAVIYLVTQQNYNAWGVQEGEPKINMMTAPQVKELCEYGIEMGGHTRSHIDLSKCSEDERMKEIRGSKEDVERLTNKKAISFAYPFGGINDDVKNSTKAAGYMYAVATNTGPKQFGEDLFQIRRIEIMPKTTLMSFKNKVSGNYFYHSFFKSLFTSKQLQ